MSYVCSGFPVWLRDIPGIEFRTNNEPFKVECFVGWHWFYLFIYLFINRNIEFISVFLKINTQWILLFNWTWKALP